MTSPATIGDLEGISLEADNNKEGWRRYLCEAFFFEEIMFRHKLKLDLDWMKVRSNESEGAISLSPRLSENRFLMEIKKNYPHFNDNIFAIYMGSGDQSSIQFGGYESKYAYQTINGHLHQGMLIKSEDSWILHVKKLYLSKDDHGKYADYILKQ